ncbi:hypothetical protein JTB14_004073 [Gonioctena quinquepunctata]|nr:hypothetical protein JTB14_004073 [Gonioctena quinquepunctata]
MDQNQDPPTTLKEKMRNSKDKPLSEADNNFKARVEKSQKELKQKMKDKEKNSKSKPKENIKDINRFIKNINLKDAKEAGPSNINNKKTERQQQISDVEQRNHSQSDTDYTPKNKNVKEK